MDFTQRTVGKEIFEKACDLDLEIVDWGNIEGPLRQLMHASLYAYCVKVCRTDEGGKEGKNYLYHVQENEEPKLTRTVRFLSINKLNGRSKRMLSLTLFFIFCFLFLAL
jgi:hypothetical protein